MSPTTNSPLKVSYISTNIARAKGLVLCALVSLLAILTASATTVINTFTNWDGSRTAGWGAVAQSFTVPDSPDTLLTRFTFNLGGNGTSYQFSIVDVVAGQPTGPALYSTDRPWNVGDETISGINLPLNAGQQYAALINFQGYTSLSVAFNWPASFDPYTGGQGYWSGYEQAEWTSFDNADLLFRAEFVPVPEPSAIALLVFGGAALMIFYRHAPGRPRTRMA